MQLVKSDWVDRVGTPQLNAELALALRASGYFILEHAIRAPLLTRLADAFSALLDNYTRTHEANRGANRFNTHLYLDGVFADEELVANPIVMPLLRRLLGVDLACSWAAADTPMPGSDYQPIHPDGRSLFRGQGLSLPAYAIAVNVPLVDFTEENGPLEIWPHGSHLVPDVIPEAAARGRDPVRVIMPAGSILVRDNRMWHRGSPNRSDKPRPNLAFVYNRSWYRFEGEAGHTPPAVSAAAYEGWSPDTQRLFRFASTDLALTAARREEMAMQVENIEREKEREEGASFALLAATP